MLRPRVSNGPETRRFIGSEVFNCYYNNIKSAKSQSRSPLSHPAIANQSRHSQRCPIVSCTFSREDSSPRRQSALALDIVLQP